MNTASRILLFAAGVGLLASCTDRLPTDIARWQRDGGSDGPAASLVPAEPADALGGIDDALNRIVPALTDQTAARQLEGALNGLRTAMANADVEAVPDLTAVAAAAVDRYARTGLDDADLDAIRLGIDHARRTLASR